MLHDQFTLSREEIGNLCDVHLLYMGPGKFAEIKRIRPPTPHMPGSLAPLPSLRVTPINSVTPLKDGEAVVKSPTGVTNINIQMSLCSKVTEKDVRIHVTYLTSLSFQIKKK